MSVRTTEVSVSTSHHLQLSEASPILSLASWWSHSGHSHSSMWALGWAQRWYSHTWHSCILSASLSPGYIFSIRRSLVCVKGCSLPAAHGASDPGFQKEQPALGSGVSDAASSNICCCCLWTFNFHIWLDSCQKAQEPPQWTVSFQSQTLKSVLPDCGLLSCDVPPREVWWKHEVNFKSNVGL